MEVRLDGTVVHVAAGGVTLCGDEEGYCMNLEVVLTREQFVKYFDELVKDGKVVMPTPSCI